MSSDSSTFHHKLTSCNVVLARVLNVLAVVVISILVLDVVWGVLTRYVWNEQAKWTEELARFLLIWVSLLGGAIAFRAKEHLGIDFVVNQLEPSVRKSVALFNEWLVSFVAAAVLIYGGSQLVRDALVLEQTTPALGWQMGYVYLVIPIVGFFVLLFSIESILVIWKTDPDELFREFEEASLEDAPTISEGKPFPNTADEA